MWFSAVFSLALIGAMAPFWFGILPPPNARCLIRIRNGGSFVLGESLPRHVMISVAEVLQDRGIKKGFIAITRDSRVKFSYHIPKTVHQRLRNVLLNP